MVSAALPVLGCGIVTGLSDDYTFTSGGVDAATSDGAADSAAGDGGAALEAGAEAGACTLPTTPIPNACRVCLENACCTLPECAANAACSAYARCRAECSGSSRETCVKQCESRASSEAKDLLSTAVQKCSLTQACRNTCNMP